MKKVIPLIVLICIISICCYSNYKDKTPPVIINFSAYPDTIISGQSLTLSWQIENGSSAIIEPIMVSANAIGEMVLQPTSDCSYTLIVKNEYGSDNKTIEINVLPSPPTPGNNDIPFPPVIDYFTAEPDENWAGSPMRITWEVSDATELFLRWGQNEINLTPVDKGNIVFHPVVDTSYLLIAENRGGNALATLDIEIFSSIGDYGSGNADGGGGCT
jgi:hypothetical protein